MFFPLTKSISVGCVVAFFKIFTILYTCENIILSIYHAQNIIDTFVITCYGALTKKHREKFYTLPFVELHKFVYYNMSYVSSRCCPSTRNTASRG